MQLIIAPLSHADPDAVEALLDAAFGADRHQRTAYRIRRGMTALPDLSFAAFDEDCLVGSLQSWPVALDDAPLILVGPVAVQPDAQGGGIGRTLMNALIEKAPQAPMVMIGDPEYYGRFWGFDADATAEWEVPGPVDRNRLLARCVGSFSRSGILGRRAFAAAPATA